MIAVIIFFSFLILGIILWVVGAKRKGTKENRSLNWYATYITGIIITSLFSLLIGIPLIIGLTIGVTQGAKIGMNDALYRQKAEALLETAKRNQSLELAQQAVANAQESLKYPTTQYYTNKDTQVLQQAQQLVNELSAKQNAAVKPL